MVVYPALNSTSCLEHFKMLGWLLYKSFTSVAKNQMEKTPPTKEFKKKMLPDQQNKNLGGLQWGVWTKQENMYEPGNMKATQLYDSSTIPVE